MIPLWQFLLAFGALLVMSVVVTGCGMRSAYRMGRRHERTTDVERIRRLRVALVVATDELREAVRRLNPESERLGSAADDAELALIETAGPV